MIGFIILWFVLLFSICVVLKYFQLKLLKRAEEEKEKKEVREKARERRIFWKMYRGENVRKREKSHEKDA